MSDLKNRKVLKAELHDVSHALGVGGVPKTITSALGGKTDGSTLTYIPGEGVLVEGSSQTNVKFSFLLPTAMCKLIQFVNE